MTRQFTDIKEDLIPDGGLRDIYIKSISYVEWNRFIEIAPKLADRFVFKCGDKEMPLPTIYTEISQLKNNNPTVLCLWISGGILNCHFFIESEIELDFRPEDFKDEDRWNKLMEFLKYIVDDIGKKAVITREDSEDEIIEEVVPG